MSACYGIVITPQGAIERLTEKPGGDRLREIVGGWLEHVSLSEDGAVGMLLNEEGKLSPHYRNEAATALFHAAGGAPDDYIAGTAVVVREVDGEIDEIDPNWVTDALFKAFSSGRRVSALWSGGYISGTDLGPEEDR